uniref:Uncharacterized protein n=1 Tax=Arundo donax TaxID=35708 RepID=A0A0A9AQN3_ARUDO
MATMKVNVIIVRMIRRIMGRCLPLLPPLIVIL